MHLHQCTLGLIQKYWGSWWKSLWKSSLSHFPSYTSSPSYLGRRGLEVSKCETVLQERQIYERQVLLDQPDILLWQRDPITWWGKGCWCAPTWASEKPLAPFPTAFSERNWLLMAWKVHCSIVKTGWMAVLREWWWMESYPAGSPSWMVFPGASYWGQFCLVSLSAVWMRGLNAASQSLQITSSWVRVLNCWSLERRYRGIWNSWIDGLRPVVWGSTRPSAR